MTGAALVVGASGALGAAVVRALERHARPIVELVGPGEGGRPSRHPSLAVDVTEAVALAGAVDVLEADVGPVTQVVCTVGGHVGGRSVQEAGWPLFERMLHLNFRTAVTVSQVLLPRLEARQGALVLVGSAGARRAAPGQSAYAASKWALHGFAAHLAAEVAPRVRVGLVLPETMDTEANRRAGVHAELQPDEVAERILELLVAPVTPGRPLLVAEVPDQRRMVT